MGTLPFIPASNIPARSGVHGAEELKQSNSRKGRLPAWRRAGDFAVPGPRRSASTASPNPSVKSTEIISCNCDSDALQQVQKLASLGVAASAMAHDFVNLMTGVRGYGEFALMQGTSSPAASVALEKILAIADRAAEMCQQILSSATSDRQQQAVPTNLSQLAEETGDMVKWRISKNAKLELDLSRDLPVIEAHPSQLRQVLMNLFINASDALNGRPGTVRVETGVMKATPEFLRETISASEIEEGEFVFVEVSDTGCGMSGETLARIFQPFFTTKSSGRGLGLAAVLDIARAHGGALYVCSEVGHGTTFRLLFPVASARPGGRI